MKRDHYYLFFILFLLFAATGCGKNCKVSGKVTYPDGKPVTAGKVIFETDTYFASGWLTEDGTYKLGGAEIGDGVLPGTYRVSISSPVEPIITELPPLRQGGTPRFKSVMPPLPFDNKYSGGLTSGITCTVKRSMKFDFQVEYPPEDQAK